eukprot:3122031-Amphidinium_carterae.1
MSLTTSEIHVCSDPTCVEWLLEFDNESFHVCLQAALRAIRGIEACNKDDAPIAESLLMSELQKAEQSRLLDWACVETEWILFGVAACHVAHGQMFPRKAMGNQLSKKLESDVAEWVENLRLSESWRKRVEVHT